MYIYGDLDHGSKGTQKNEGLPFSFMIHACITHEMIEQSPENLTVGRHQQVGSRLPDTNQQTDRHVTSHKSTTQRDPTVTQAQHSILGTDSGGRGSIAEATRQVWHLIAVECAQYTA